MPRMEGVTPATSFGEMVRELREERRWTLTELAKRCGTHKGYLSGIENCKVNPPSIRFIRKMVRVFEPVKTKERNLLLFDLAVHAFAEKAPMELRAYVRAHLLGDESGVRS